jgi:L-threonylcarbamoyladenylate synthase
MNEKAIEILKKGGIIVYPTDTVYGIGTSMFNKEGIERIFEIKGRNKKIPVSIAVSSIEMAKKMAYFDDPSERMFLKYMPGSLTMILKNKGAPENITRGSGTVGIRMPANEIVLRIIEGLGNPITSTSANMHGKPPATTIKEAKEQLGNEIDLYVDGGVCDKRASTIFDCIHKKVIREGDLMIEIEEE